MLTAKEAWEKTNRQEMIDAYMHVVEDGIRDAIDKGDMFTVVDFYKEVSSFIKTKIKDILTDNGYTVKVFPGENEGLTYEISWEMEDGEETSRT